MESIPQAHIVYCDVRMLLDRRTYRHWGEIQDAYPDYKTSLGAWSEAEILEFLEMDFGPDDLKWPFTRAAITDFFSSNDALLERREV